MKSKNGLLAKIKSVIIDGDAAETTAVVRISHPFNSGPMIISGYEES
jgi:hypothetical protein